MSDEIADMEVSFLILNFHHSACSYGLHDYSNSEKEERYAIEVGGAPNCKVITKTGFFSHTHKLTHTRKDTLTDTQMRRQDNRQTYA